MVAHNAMFDFGFINAAARRSNITKSPFHPFTAFDTATLAGFAYGQTVLAKARPPASSTILRRRTELCMTARSRLSCSAGW